VLIAFVPFTPAARSTVRSLTAVLSAAVVLAGTIVAGSPAAAAPVPKADAIPGSYSALDKPVRTATNVAVPARNAVTVTIAGGSTGVPVAGTSVAVNLSMQPPAQTGSLTVFRYLANRPSTANVEFTTGHRTSDFALVTSNEQSDGKARIYNNSAGPVSVTVDVVGSYQGQAGPGAVKGYRPVSPSRILSASLVANSTISPVLGGHGQLPTKEIGAVAVTFSEFSAQHAGYLAAGPYSVPFTPGRVLRWPGGGLRAGAFAVVPVDPDGQMMLTNYSAGSMQVTADVVGYFTSGAPSQPGMLNTVPASRVLQAQYVGASTHDLSLAGHGGVVKQGASAVVVTLTAGSPSSSGSVLAYNPDHPRPTQASIQYAAGVLQANTAIVPLSADGKIKIFNNGPGTVNLTVDLVGWVIGSVLTPPPTWSSRYLDDLTGVPSHDNNLMTQHGIADADSGARFVLLDVGAQSRHAPLSASNPGVALALTSPTIRLPYPQLVDALTAYAQGVASVVGSTPAVTIAVGTNNSGNFTDSSDPANPIYPATYRGQEWANRVIEKVQERVQAPTRITVVAADDIENGNPDSDGFDDSAARALQWETAYLAAHVPNGDAPDLIYNGSANGCPNTFDAGSSSTPCADGWKLSNFVSLTRRGSRIGVLPQIYFPYMAIQWANIDRVAQAIGTREPLNFVGSLSERSLPGSLVPPQSWASLRNALGTLVDAPDIWYAIDIEPAAAASAVLERARAVA
jgi:hypothetical protein